MFDAMADEPIELSTLEISELQEEKTLAFEIL
jgi:hypothetical protein